MTRTTLTWIPALALALSGLASAQDAAPSTPAPSYPRVSAYFGPPDADHQAQRVNQPSPGGFYRMALGPDGKGCERFQDFYQDNGARQSNEVTTCDPDDLTRWDGQGFQGLILGYRPTGQLRSRQTLHLGVPHGRDHYYDDRGRERISVSWQHGQVHGAFRFKDISGRVRIEGVAHESEVRQIRAWKNGRKLSRTQALALYNQAQQTWYADMFR